MCGIAVFVAVAAAVVIAVQSIVSAIAAKPDVNEEQEWLGI